MLTVSEFTDRSERYDWDDVEAGLRRTGAARLPGRLSADECTLGQLLFGPGEVARLLLVEHKSAVSAVLLALVER